MKRHELLDHLRRHGCELEREGSRHTIFRNIGGGQLVPVPRHVEIDNRLARRICQQLGVAAPR